MYGISLRLDSINKHSTSVTRLVDDMFIYFAVGFTNIIVVCSVAVWNVAVKHVFGYWSDTVCDILVNDQYSGYIKLVNS